MVSLFLICGFGAPDRPRQAVAAARAELYYSTILMFETQRIIAVVFS